MTTKSKILLVLDLDETLIHATQEKLPIAEDFLFDKYFIYKRPGLLDFLDEIQEHFRIAVWSSAGDEYVQEIVKLISNESIQFEFVWGRTRCTAKHDLELDIHYWEKRLDKLKKKGFSLEEILIVDDSPEKARNNFGNAIYIKPFLGQQNDGELKLLLNYLLKMKDVTNVRKIEKRNWRKS